MTAMLQELLPGFSHGDAAASKVGLLVLATLAAYALLGGADLGGGIWDLLARGPRRDAQRHAIAQAMGPVWEANHIWLIFALVLLFTAFPRAFGALNVGLFVPLHLVLLGIVLRGAAFAFRSAAKADRMRQAWGAVFGGASATAAFFLGVSLAGVSGGIVRLSGDGSVVALPFAEWASRPLAVGMGALAVALSAYLAAVYMTVETAGELREDFRRRALWSGAAVAGLSALLLAVMRQDAPHLAEGLLGRGLWALVVPGGLLAAAAAAALWHRRFWLARMLAAGHAVVLVLGWGVAQWPYLLYPHLTLAESAAPAATLNAVLQAVPVGLALLVPSLWLLFAVFKLRRRDAIVRD